MTSVVSGGLLTVEQAAKRLAMSRTSLYGLMDNGRLPFFKIGRSRRVDPSDLASFLASCRVGPHNNQLQGHSGPVATQGFTEPYSQSTATPPGPAAATPAPVSRRGKKGA